MPAPPPWAVSSSEPAAAAGARARGGAHRLPGRQPVLVGLDELEEDDQVMVMTGVGAPGTQRQLVWPRDGLARSSWPATSGMGRHDRRHHDGASGRVHGRHLARQRARSAPRGHRLQRRRRAVIRPSRWRHGLPGRTNIDVVQAARGAQDHLGHVEIVAAGRSALVSASPSRLRRDGGSLLASRGRSRRVLREYGAVGASLPASTWARR